MAIIENWKEITDELPFGHYLVTNNLNATENGGLMSHVWHTRMVHKSTEWYGPFSAFHGTNDARVCGITHYIDLSPIVKKETNNDQ